jgi:lipoprotein signal peptidase
VTWETTAAALLTLAIYSFLAGDNPVYKFAEHLLVGLTIGYTLVVTLKSVIWPQGVLPVIGGDFLALLPLLLGAFVLLRLVKRWAPWSRIPLALVVGGGAGVAIPAMLQARVLKQMAATISGVNGFNGWVILIGVVMTLTYFVFSREHTGAWGAATRVGRYFMMVFFGATFAYTVMSRVALFIGRLEFLLADWLGLLGA